MDLFSKVAVSLGVFGSVTALAALLGAANLGTALGIGQVAFAATATLLLVRY